VVELVRARRVRELAGAHLRPVLVLEQLVQRQPKGVHEPRQHGQRRHVRPVLDGGEIRGRQVGLASDVGERPAEREPAFTQAAAEPGCERAAARRLAQTIGGSTSHTLSSGSSDVTVSECSWCDE
jgi:hypothetical protein